MGFWQMDLGISGKEIQWDKLGHLEHLPPNDDYNWWKQLKHVCVSLVYNYICYIKSHIQK